MNTNNIRFGTDGIRGIYGAGLDWSLAYRAGLAAAACFGGAGKILLAMDTRTSSAEIASALREGLCLGGMDVLSLGVLPTPAVSYLCAKLGCAGGVMVTASHNPPQFNGIKFLGRKGEKLAQDDEQKIEYYIDNPPPKATRGRAFDMDAGDIYLSHLLEIAGDLSGLNIALDCGYGATYKLAPEFFRCAGAAVKTLCCTPDGKRINVASGALYPVVAAGFTSCGYDLGFSLDGDGDRLAVSEGGTAMDGDSVLYNLAKITDADVVVATILSNSALEERLASDNKKLFRTPVGDKYIFRLMQQKNYPLGGEQSGHYIIRPHCTTGDALLAAALLASFVVKRKTNPAQNGLDVCKNSVSSHSGLERLELVPQRSISKFAISERLEKEDIRELIKNSTAALEGNGRLIVRMSGTEPKMRITVESQNQPLMEQILQAFEEIL